MSTIPTFDDWSTYVIEKMHWLIDWAERRRVNALRALRWVVRLRELVLRQKVQFALLGSFTVLSVVAWHFRKSIHIPKTGADTWIDIVLGTALLAIVPFVMAAYGGYIAAESISELKKRQKVKLIFWAICLVGVSLAFVQQFRSVTQDALSKSKTSQVEGAILGQLQNLHAQGNNSTPEQVEAKRREDIIAMLRGQYILQHENIAPGIVEGTTPLPAEWVNNRLHELHESWTVANNPTTEAKAAPVNSYISWPNNPSFPRTKIGGDVHFQIGDAFGFNVDFKNTGPNPVTVISTCKTLYIKADDKLDTQREIVADFKSLCADWQKSNAVSKSTMFPQQTKFFSAVAPTDTKQIRTITDEDLTKLKNAEEFAYIVAEIKYIDNGTFRRLPLCIWLQPPAEPPGIWHFCDVFN